MKDLELDIDVGKCIKCGMCVKECPAGSIVGEKTVPTPSASQERVEECLECQHCLAVCPTGALSIFGIKPENSFSLKKDALPTHDQIAALMRCRRSIRQYKRENVSKELIDALFDDISYAPTGTNNQALSYLLVDDAGEARKLLTRIYETVESAAKAGREIPDFLVEGAVAYRERGDDLLFRGAPHVLVVSAEDDAPCGAQDVIIALSHFEIAAQTVGVGTTWLGFLSYVASLLPEVREFLGLGPDAPYYAMLFGYPDIAFPRAVQRDVRARITRYRS